MISPINKKPDPSVPSNVPPNQNPLNDSAAKAEAATDKVLSKKPSKETKIHKAGPVPPSQNVEISGRINIPPNFKSLPLVLQLQIVGNLKIRELEALKVSLGKKGNPELVNRINAHLGALKAFPILANFLNKEDVTQKASVGKFPLNNIYICLREDIADFLSPEELAKFSVTSKGNQRFARRIDIVKLRKKEIDNILKRHPEWKSAVNSWITNQADTLWLLRLYELNQHFPIRFLESSKPEPHGARALLSVRKEIMEELNKKYEELKKILKQ